MEMRLSLLVGMFALTQTAMAQEAQGQGQDWSLSTGRTVGEGANVLSGTIGWPGIEGRFVHGLSSRFDVGGRFAFLYGYTVGVGIAPALTFGSVLKAGLLRNGMVSLGLEFDPGVGFGFDRSGSFLVHFPLELQLGVSPSSVVNIVFGTQLTPTLIVRFNSVFSFAMPVLFGPGVELFLARDWMVTVAARFGPGVYVERPTSLVAFSFVATFGIAYRFE